MWVYYLGLGTIGVVVGLFTGLSNSPVVGVLLPLLFGLISGIGGLYLVKSKSDEEVALSIKKMKRIGLSLTVLACTTLASAIYGIKVRLPEASFLDLIFIDRQDQNAIDVEGVDAKEAVNLIVLNRLLFSLGATRGQVKNIQSQMYAIPEGTIDGTLKNLSNAFSKTINSITILQETRKINETDREKFSRLAHTVSQAQKDIRALTERTDRQHSVLEDAYRICNTLMIDLLKSQDVDSFAKWLEKSPQIAVSLWQMYYYMLDLRVMSPEPTAADLLNSLATILKSLGDSKLLKDGAPKTNLNLESAENR